MQIHVVDQEPKDLTADAAVTQVLYAKGPQSQTRGAMILQAFLNPEAAAATAASNAQGGFRPINISPI